MEKFTCCLKKLQYIIKHVYENKLTTHINYRLRVKRLKGNLNTQCFRNQSIEAYSCDVSSITEKVTKSDHVGLCKC